MTPEITFIGLLVVTVGFLLGAAITGRRKTPRPHLAFVACAVLSLAGAIAAALRLGDLYDLEAAGWITPVHLTIARIATAAYLIPLTTGPLVWSGRMGASWHRRGAWLAIGLTLIATFTGAWMLLAAEPMPTPE